MPVQNLKVSLVINTENNNRVSTFYTRLGDAERKAKQMNTHSANKQYAAKEYLLIEAKEATIENQDHQVL